MVVAPPLGVPDQHDALPMIAIQDVGNAISDGAEDVADTTVADVGYDGYSTDEDEALALVAESGKKQ